MLNWFRRQAVPNRGPPERFHLFVSYTSREEEAAAAKRILDPFLKETLGPQIERVIGEPPVFYDACTLRKVGKDTQSKQHLGDLLRFAVEESEVLLAFVSPQYLDSEWCRFECAEMSRKQFRPWFDVVRKPPEGFPQAPARPRTVDLAQAKRLMKTWRSTTPEPSPGGTIVAILWRVEPAKAKNHPDLSGYPMFDWTTCDPEFIGRVRSHLARHGSVSPNDFAMAEAQEQIIGSTAFAILNVLRRRRNERNFT